MRKYFIEFCLKAGKAWWAVVVGFAVGAIRLGWAILITDPDNPRNLSISIWQWIALTAIGAVIAAFVAFVKVARERDALKDTGAKSKLHTLARELHEMLRDSSRGDIHGLKKNVHRTTGATEVEQVEDAKRRLMDFIKTVKTKLIGTAWDSEFGYDDTSCEWARIRDVDASNILDALNTLDKENQRVVTRLLDVSNHMNESAAAITTNALRD